MRGRGWSKPRGAKSLFLTYLTLPILGQDTCVDPASYGELLQEGQALLQVNLSHFKPQFPHLPGN